MAFTTTSASSTDKRVLLLGARGFIGRHLLPRLARQGFAVRSAGRSSTPRVDFAHMRSASQWLPVLQDVDVVINAVGILRSTGGNAIADVHQHSPMALFEACVQSGVRQIVQISALGVDGNETDYARTKRAADLHLLALAEKHDALRALIIRPSVVIGKGGASTQLFTRLAKLPVLLMPAPMLSHAIQPIAVGDLCDAIVQLILKERTGIVELGGPEPLSMAALVASLRAQMGLRPARVHRLPDSITRLSARCGDLVSASPWSSASLELASHDNCCDPRTALALLGRASIAPAQLLASMRG